MAERLARTFHVPAQVAQQFDQLIQGMQRELPGGVHPGDVVGAAMIVYLRLDRLNKDSLLREVRGVVQDNSSDEEHEDEREQW